MRNKSLEQSKYFWKFKVCHSQIIFISLFTVSSSNLNSFNEFKSLNVFNIFYIRHFRFCNVGRSVYFEISTICGRSASYNLRLEEGWVFQPGVDFCFEICLIELTVNWISRITRSFRTQPTIDVVDELGDKIETDLIFLALRPVLGSKPNWPFNIAKEFNRKPISHIIIICVK